MSSKQEVFNKVYLGLQSQGWKQSLNAVGDCSYRGDNGCKCAAGHLIPDEYYDPIMEGTVFLSGRSLKLGGIDIFNRKSATAAFHKLHIAFPDLDQADTLISDMQGIHDACHNPKKMEEEFVKLAKEYDLSVPKSVI